MVTAAVVLLAAQLPLRGDDYYLMDFNTSFSATNGYPLGQSAWNIYAAPANVNGSSIQDTAGSTAAGITLSVSGSITDSGTSGTAVFSNALGGASWITGSGAMSNTAAISDYFFTDNNVAVHTNIFTLSNLTAGVLVSIDIHMSRISGQGGHGRFDYSLDNGSTWTGFTVMEPNDSVTTSDGWNTNTTATKTFDAFNDGYAAARYMSSGFVVLSTNTLRFRVTDAPGSSYSGITAARLTVVGAPPPAMTGAQATAADTVVLTFDEDVDTVTGEDESNYTITPGITVIAANVGPANNAVTLTTSTLTTGLLYTVVVTNVENLSGDMFTLGTTDTFIYTVILPPSVGAASILFDLGNSSFTTPGNWNNVISATAGSITDAVDSNGEVTTVGYTTLNGFQADNTAGVVDSSLYPDTAQRDTFFLSSTGDTQAVIRISGLVTNKTFEFRFFASRAAAGNFNRTATYTIGSSTVQLNAADNTANFASITGVAADSSGNVDILIQLASGQDFAYLGVLEIISSTGFSAEIPTLGEWAMIILCVLIVFIGARRMRLLPARISGLRG